MTTSTATRNLNRLAGSSASGMYVVLDVTTGDISHTLFTAGSRPTLNADQRLVQVGRRFHRDDVAEIIGNGAW